MNKFSPEVEILLQLLEKKQKLTAMLAPSFPIDFEYPQIVGQLKRLGFSYVVEVARGAKETNQQLLQLVKKNPSARYITSPCPAIVRLIWTKYPHLKKFLAPVGSPMFYTAQTVRQKYPGTKPVFIAPCPVKKFEACQDYPELNILVLTYKEIKQVFTLKKIKKNLDDQLASFDLVGPSTRLYPISGGLSQSSGLNNFLTDGEYDVISGFKLVEKALQEFPKNKLRVLDILYCDGGCISGQGIASNLALEERRKKVIAHWVKASLESHP